MKLKALAILSFIFLINTAYSQDANSDTTKLNNDKKTNQDLRKMQSISQVGLSGYPL